jgi:lauroyl/myristoyl acyltransferase
MANTFQKFVESSLGLGLASVLGRTLPTRLGYSLAEQIATWIVSRRDSKLVRAVRANQWVIRGEKLEKEALDQAVLETFQHLAHSIFDLYHYIRRPEAAMQRIVMDQATRQLFQRPEFDDRGLMIVGLHISNFDLAMQTFCQLGLKLTALTIPNPQKGRQTEFELRQQSGVNLFPASVDGFRYALKYLQRGGVVLTGIDRPISDPGARPRFFGRYSVLPLHHIFLATKARVPMMIITTNLEADGKYHIYTSDLIEMDQHPDREKGMLLNGEMVLRYSESFIKRKPHQWSMTLPVWPEILSVVPD